MGGRDRWMLDRRKEGEKIAERWYKMNGMSDCDIRLMAEGRISG